MERENMPEKDLDNRMTTGSGHSLTVSSFSHLVSRKGWFKFVQSNI